MYKKTLLSLAVASSITLTGCIGSTESGDDEVTQNPDAAGLTWPLFNPAAGLLPIPSDLNFDTDAGDGSFDVDGDMDNPVIGALNNLSGASTIAPAVVRFNGQIDPDSVDSRPFIPNPAFDPAADEPGSPVIPNPNQNVFLLELEHASGAPVRALSSSEPPTIPLALTFQVAAGMDPLGTGLDLSDRNQMQAVGYLQSLVDSPAYDHDVVELDGTSAIRIRPLKPLNPLTRYTVVVTDGVKEIDGETPISASPVYASLSDEENQVPPSLKAVQTIINDLWEELSTTYFAVNNSSRALAQLPLLDADNIAISYTFTTSGDKDVLEYIANPASWISDQLKRSIAADAARLRVDAAKVFTSNATGEPSGVDPTNYELPETASDAEAKAAVVAALVALGKEEGTPVVPGDFLRPDNADPTEFGFADVKFYVDATLGGFVPSSIPVPPPASLVPCDGLPVEANEMQPTTKFDCVGDTVSALLTGALAAEGLSLEQPGALENISINSTDDLAEITSAASLLQIPRGAVDVHQGDITLPYYVAVPDSTQTGPTSTIKTQSWRPDPDVAGTAGGAVNIDIPQSDESVSDVHNYNFPFPSKQDDVKVPMLVITPSGWNPTLTDADPVTAGDQKLIPVIYQHGITTDRSAALTFGSALVANAAARGINIALFAIDQPLHGIAPFDRDDQEFFASTLLEVAGSIGETGTDAEDNITYATPEDEALVDSVIDGGFITQALNGAQDTIDTNLELLGVTNSLGITSESTLEEIREVASRVLESDESLLTENGVPPAGTGAPVPPEATADAILVGLNSNADLISAIVLDRTIANSGSTIPGLAPQSTATGFVEDEINERHFGFTADGSANPIAMDFEAGVGSSGSLFINLNNFPVSRDTLKQGALDLMNLAATVDSLEGTAGMPVFIGHSLGTFNGAAFVGASTASGREDIMMGGAHLMTPVAGVTRLLENSPSFAPTILGGLAANPSGAVVQGDADLETFLNVNQATLDSVDPMNFADELAVSNLLLSQINGDRTTPNAAGPNAAFDIAEANAEPALDIMIGNLDINSFQAPLSGSEPLAAVMGANASPTGQVMGFLLPSITRYSEGTHSLPVLPIGVEAEEGDVLKDRTIAAGGETIVSAEAAEATFESLIAQTIALIGQVNAPPQEEAPALEQVAPR